MLHGQQQFVTLAQVPVLRSYIQPVYIERGHAVVCSAYLLWKGVGGISLICPLNRLTIVPGVKREHSGLIVKLSVVQARDNACPEVEPCVPHNAEDGLIWPSTATCQNRQCQQRLVTPLPAIEMTCVVASQLSVVRASRSPLLALWSCLAVARSNRPEY